MTVMDNTTYDAWEADRLIGVDRWCRVAFLNLRDDGELSSDTLTYFDNCDASEKMLCWKTLAGFLNNNGGGGIIISDPDKKTFLKKLDQQIRTSFLSTISGLTGDHLSFYETIKASGCRLRNPAWGVTSDNLDDYYTYAPGDLIWTFGSRLVGDWDIGNPSSLVLNTGYTPNRVAQVLDSSGGFVRLKNLLPTQGSSTQTQANYDPTRNTRGMWQSFQDYYQAVAKINLPANDWVMGFVVDVTTHGWVFWSQISDLVGTRGDIFVGTQNWADSYNPAGGTKVSGSGKKNLQVLIWETGGGNAELRTYNTTGVRSICSSTYTKRGMSSSSTYGQLTTVSYDSVAQFGGYFGGMTIIRSPQSGDGDALATALCARWGIEVPLI